MTAAQSASATDDYPLAQLPDTPMWSENYAYTCNNGATGVSMFVQIGRWWADPTVWREVVAIALPGERLVCIKNYGRTATDKVVSGAMFRHEVVRRGQTLKLLYDGPAFEQDRAELLRHGFIPAIAKRCRMEIVFEGITPVWDMSGRNTAGAHHVEVAGAYHIEQVGRGDGHITFGNEHFEIRNAFMNRDHSRGVRIMNRVKRHCWAQGYFAEDDVSFSVYAIEQYGEEGCGMANASVSKNGRRYPASVTHVSLMRGNVDACQPFRLVLNSELGEMVLNRVRTYTSAPTSCVSPFDLHHGMTPGVPSGLTFEEACSWEWQDKQGLGWSERCYFPEPLYLYEPS